MFVASYFVGFYKRRIMQRLWLILAAFLGLAAMTVPASADLQFTLACNSIACGAPTNYGTVKLHQVDSTHVTVTVQLAAGVAFAGTGAGYAISWDLKSSSGCVAAACYPGPALASVTIDALTPNPGNFNPPTTVAELSGVQNYKNSPFTGGACGAGSDCYEYGIDYGPSGGGGTDQKLVFDITTNSAVLLTDFNSNPSGFKFVSDISLNGGSGGTFVVGAKGDGVKVPEPETWMLFFAGLVGLTALNVLQRRRKLARAA